ncbi:MarR family protein [Pelotomaculum sp. FP]|uniref:MarR family winged helix-turn-helix transcriptional regulator n=1 Tax=Pelotomaculum sp. FP TaxID=261474 RepID=UPI001066B8A1|nr:MarR family winged helix-turn-helix transcriptional regulator [Pelotomaculum sp. FP]TEB15857.1 MarR family protein [Pelotomaculum sp. FP]
MSRSHLSGMRRCACGNLRRTTRAITQFYDQLLQPCGLRSTQISLLLNISLHGNISVGELGSILLMDQTTVTRNIEILRKLGYVNVTKEDNDARKKSISITESGARKLVEAEPLWEQAQSRIEQGLGSERYRDFLKMLKDVAQLLQ